MDSPEVECLNSKIAIYSKMLVIYVISLIVLLSMSIYLIIRLSKLYKQWRKRQDRFEENIRIDTTDGNSTKFQSMLSMSVKNKDDDEIYKNNGVSSNLEYDYKFDENLNNIVEMYKQNIASGKTCLVKNNSSNVDPDRAFIRKEYDEY